VCDPFAPVWPRTVAAKDSSEQCIAHHHMLLTVSCGHRQLEAAEIKTFGDDDVAAAIPR